VIRKNPHPKTRPTVGAFLCTEGTKKGRFTLSKSYSLEGKAEGRGPAFYRGGRGGGPRGRKRTKRKPDFSTGQKRRTIKDTYFVGENDFSLERKSDARERSGQIQQKKKKGGRTKESKNSARRARALIIERTQGVEKT